MTPTNFKDISDIEKIMRPKFCEILERELGYKVDSFQFNLTSEDQPMIDGYGSNRGFTTKRSIELEIDDGMFSHVINGKQAEEYYSRCLDLLNVCVTVFRNPPPIVFHSLL